MSLELLFLGTGTSAGIPMIACGHTDCACQSTDPRDARTRASAVVRYPDAKGQWRTILIDTGPDLRMQAVRAQLMRVDAVVYTHHHMDHVLGIDELRRFNAVMAQALEIHAEPRVLESLQRMFPHIFESHKNINPSFVPKLIPLPINANTPFDLFGATWTPVRLMHGRLPILGFRVDAPEVGIEVETHPGSGATVTSSDQSDTATRAGLKSIAYCTDVSAIPPESYPLLADLDVLVLDGLRYRHHPTHLTIDQAMQIIDELSPKQAYLTHMAHEVIHAQLDAELPEDVSPAYDGLLVRSVPSCNRN